MWKCKYVETSAKEGTNVNELFEELLKLETSRTLSLQPIEETDKKKSGKKGKCNLMWRNTMFEQLGEKTQRVRELKYAFWLSKIVSMFFFIFHYCFGI